METPKLLYWNAVSVRRVMCSKKGYIEYIQKQTDESRTIGFYALYTHERVLIGTCGYQAGIDRFSEYSEMREFLLNDGIWFDPATGAITTI